MSGLTRGTAGQADEGAAEIDVHRILEQIERRLGFCPALFKSLSQLPEALDVYWRQAQSAYLNSPLPGIVKERLFAYLSRYCAQPYCMARHAVWLIERQERDRDNGRASMAAAEVVAFLRRPRPRPQELEAMLERLASEPKLEAVWPQPGSWLETQLFACAVTCFLREPLAGKCHEALQRILPRRGYESLLMLLTFVHSSQFWADARGTVELDPDIHQAMRAHPELARWLAEYREEVAREQQDLAPLNQVLAREKRRFEGVVRSIPDALVMADMEHRVTFCTPNVRSVFGYDPEELIGRHKSIFFADPEAYRDLEAQQSGQAAGAVSTPVEMELRRKSGECFAGEIVSTVLVGEDGEAFGCLALVRDVSVRKQAEAKLQRYNRVLEALAAGASLPRLLELVVRLAEDARRGMLGSILLLDASGRRLRSGALGRLPASFSEAVDGLEIGPNIGSCGAAAYLNQRVIAEDLLTHPNWKEYTAAAEHAGLRACWSEPIRSRDNEVLGTFAVYFREPQTPTEADLDLLRHGAQLAEIVIDRVRKDERLRESEQRYRSVVLASSAIVSTAGPRGEFSSPQHSWERYTGQPWSEHRDWGWGKMIHPDDSRRAQRAWRDVLKDPQFSTLHFRLWHAATEQYRHVEGRAVPIFNEDGSVRQWVGTTADIHDRVLAEQKLRQREHEFRMLADNVPELFSYTDAHLHFRFVNRRYEEVHRRPRSELLGRHVSELVGDRRYLQSLAQHYARALEGQRVSFEANIPTADNPGRWASVVLIPDRDEQGRVSGVYAMESDISQRRELEKQILDVSGEEARRIGNDLHDGVGQELTGLVMVADTLVTALERRGLAEVEIAEKMRTAVQRCLGEIRTMARGMNPVSVDTQGLMSALAEMARRLKNLYGVDCVFECSQPVLLPNNQVATHLYRIAQEATTNAVKHGRSSRIRIELSCEDHHATLRITDNGIGIAEDNKKKQGMGLQIMKYRAGLIEADLQIQEAASGGTDVRCTLAAEALQQPMG
ncbi:PAS domain S-box protein [Roseimaritima sediminicola]|uniref:PAS domain S-box protein n=1 Tax=Roseimaritima sediminicola TaxID=2662066 RepID=UPI0012984D6C|nr:PAS domain S-box protein [Roseimaritima sediminicola]